MVYSAFLTEKFFKNVFCVLKKSLYSSGIGSLFSNHSNFLSTKGRQTTALGILGVNQRTFEEPSKMIISSTQS